MNSFDVLVAAWCGLAWSSLLVFTAAVLVVAALRKPCRRAFGAERAFPLWLIPPVALLAGMSPHTAAPISSLPPIILSIATLPGTAASGVAGSGAGDWRLWIAALWLAGFVMVLSLAARAQFRYRTKLRGATRYEAGLRWAVLRTADPMVGPALVGAWRTCIVVPQDFDDRYDEIERRLILEHEVMHARRHDGWWCLAAQFTTAAFWFHPLAWWAISALRRDQELACDAGVMRENHGKRRSYANAMLKTLPASFALPVGCTWSPRHPLMERIGMLKQAQPGRNRRASGIVLIVVVMLLGASAAYAATAPAAAPKTSNAGTHVSEYQLEMKVEFVGGSADHQEAHRIEVAMCQVPGKAARVSSRALAVEAIATPLQGSRIRIKTTIFDAVGHKLAEPILVGALGDPLRVVVGAAGGEPRYEVDITPIAGCPAREVASHRHG